MDFDAPTKENTPMDCSTKFQFSSFDSPVSPHPLTPIKSVLKDTTNIQPFQLRLSATPIKKENQNKSSRNEEIFEIEENTSYICAKCIKTENELKALRSQLINAEQDALQYQEEYEKIHEEGKSIFNLYITKCTMLKDIFARYTALQEKMKIMENETQQIDQDSQQISVLQNELDAQNSRLEELEIQLNQQINMLNYERKKHTRSAARYTHLEEFAMVNTQNCEKAELLLLQQAENLETKLIQKDNELNEEKQKNAKLLVEIEQLKAKMASTIKW